MKNRKHWAYTGGAVTLPLTVPANTKSGDIVPLGTTGLYGVATTDRATTDLIGKGLSPQGLLDGQASVQLPGIVLTLAVAKTDLAAFADYAKVYRSAAGAYTATTTDLWVGYRLNATTLALRSN